ncbi:ASCH domain-containing protein [Kitasatospora sp. NPDC058170]|uniref:ASCH domain-containing protein n=1 Tax=Kitasatospora sp. NPDC058170 TaxID=3346364 RepID=UPI0036D9CA5F
MRTTALRSPNNVLANAVEEAIDVLRPRILASDVDAIEFVVGTQINGHPHIGTHLVQSLAFLAAQEARDAFGIEAQVTFFALDNAPCEALTDSQTGNTYQRTYWHTLSTPGLNALLAEHYTPLFDAMAERTGVPYEVTTYTAQQDTVEYRAEFLRTLDHLDAIRWWLSPAHGAAHIRIPCPQCGWAEKYAQRTRLLELDDSGALFTSTCLTHGPHEANIDPFGGGYLDLSTLYRNVVKERCYQDDRVLQVMIKGGDWAFGCQLVDGAHAAIGAPAVAPLRVFTPLILSPDGGKLSKSLLTEMEQAGQTTSGWLLNPSAWPGSAEDYLQALNATAELLLSDPRHFFRSYTTTELERLMTTHRPNPRTTGGHGRPRNMQIYKQYFDLIADGSKTVEIRVAYESMKRIRPGDLLNFTCRGEECLTRVTRVAKYQTFKEMFGTEKVEAVNPHATEAEQLRAIHAIFPPEKEALGVLAFEVERVKAS